MELTKEEIKIMEVLKTQEIRKQQRLSISQLSYKSGITRSYISELESGKYENPGIEVVCKLCKALRVTPNDLIIEELWRGKDENSINSTGVSGEMGSNSKDNN